MIPSPYKFVPHQDLLQEDGEDLDGARLRGCDVLVHGPIEEAAQQHHLREEAATRHTPLVATEQLDGLSQ
jgi:hypothetical protein